MVAIFLVVNVVLALVQLVVDTPYGTRVHTLVEIHPWTPVIFVVFSGASLLAAAGLWLSHRWGWALAMVVVGVSLVGSLYLYWLGDPAYPRMAIDVMLAFYLNQGAVRDYFERRGGPTAVDEPAPS